MTEGTPKTLLESIQNGAFKTDLNSRDVICIYKNVRDFLAQKFNTEMLETPALEESLKRIFDALGGPNG